MAPLTSEQAAALVGISKRRLYQIVRDGEGPEQAPDGRFPPAQLGKWVRERHSREFGVSTDGTARDLEAERARLTCAQADKAEIEAAELRGELLPADKVEETWIGIMADLRAKLLALPTKLARVVSADKRQLVHAAAQDAMHDALNDMARSRDGSAAKRGSQGVLDAHAAAKADGESMGGRTPLSQSRVKRGARKVVNGHG